MKMRESVSSAGRLCALIALCLKIGPEVFGIHRIERRVRRLGPRVASEKNVTMHVLTVGNGGPL